MVICEYQKHSVVFVKYIKAYYAHCFTHWNHVNSSLCLFGLPWWNKYGHLWKNVYLAIHEHQKLFRLSKLSYADDQM